MSADSEEAGSLGPGVAEPSSPFDHDRHVPGAIKRARRLRQTMPAGEKKLWAALRALKLGIRRQAPIGRYIVDFAHHSACLVVEVDGPWHDEPDVQLRDIERDAWLKSQGYRVLRIGHLEAFENPHGVAERVAAMIRPSKALLLDGGGLGGGVAAGGRGKSRSAPTGAPFRSSEATPPSPALPPSRRKGE